MQSLIDELVDLTRKAVKYQPSDLSHYMHHKALEAQAFLKAKAETPKDDKGEAAPDTLTPSRARTNRTRG